MGCLRKVEVLKKRRGDNLEQAVNFVLNHRLLQIPIFCPFLALFTDDG